MVLVSAGTLLFPTHQTLKYRRKVATEFHPLGHDDWLRDVHVASTRPVKIFPKTE